MRLITDLPTRLRHYLLMLIGGWTLAVAAFLAWDLQQIHHDTLRLAAKEARANFDKDQAFRHWASRHGGIYVPVTPRTPPNPYLEHIDDRDITTPGGRRLTLMNPAYMVRQLNEEFAEWFGARGHITSLKVLRPGNEPDPWEANALRAFEHGVGEVSEVTEIDGAPFLRLMQPMITKKHCLKCHAKQGYQEGDVRGGVSVSIPMAEYLAEQRLHILRDSLSFGTLWLLGVGALLFGGHRLGLHERKRTEAEEALRGANEDLAQFAGVASHQLQEPLRMVASYTQLLGNRYRGRLDEQADEFIGYAVGGAERMQRLIDGLLAYSYLGSKAPAREPCDAGRLLTEVREGLSEEITAAGAEIEAGELPTLPVEPDHLRLLFHHLLANALKFRGDAAPRLRIEARPEEALWHFTITDNGIGIEPRHQRRIFRLFSRLHPEQGPDDTTSTGTGDGTIDTGIGLALCMKLVALYGGRIWVESTPGEGSTFHFTLPAREYPS